VHPPLTFPSSCCTIVGALATWATTPRNNFSCDPSWYICICIYIYIYIYIHIQTASWPRTPWQSLITTKLHVYCKYIYVHVHMYIHIHTASWPRKQIASALSEMTLVIGFSSHLWYRFSKVSSIVICLVANWRLRLYKSAPYLLRER